MTRKIPDEVLLHIFQFLEIRDRLTARLVCSHWLNVVNSSGFLNSPITFNKSSVGNMKAVLQSGCIFSNFIFKNIVIDKSCIDFINSYRHQIHSLAFINCQIDQSDDTFPAYKIKEGLRLYRLEIRHCDVWQLFNALLDLDYLIIESNIDFSDSTVQKLKKIIPKLKRLCLMTKVLDPISFNKYYPPKIRLECRECWVNQPSPLVFTFPAFADFISTYAKTLCSLEFIKTNVTNEDIMEVSVIDNLKLQQVSFSGCLNLYKKVAAFCQNQTCITHLDLSLITLLSDSTIECICNTLPNLLDLALKHCIYLNTSVVNILQLKKLKRLDLSCCVGISNASFQQAANKTQCNNLVHLNLSGCKISSPVLTEILTILSQAGKMKFLDLTKCDVTNTTLSTVSPYLVELRELILRGCKDVSDNVLTNIFTNEATTDTILSLQKLKYLDFSFCFKVTDIGLCFLHLPNLEILNLQYTPTTTFSENLIFDLNPRLRELITSSGEIRFRNQVPPKC